MSRSQDLLRRFRPAGAPGAASPAGVPADRVNELSAELEPVLARLADEERTCTRTVLEARTRAERIRLEAAEQARALVAAAHRDAEQERAQAAARVTERAAHETEAALADAVAEAEAVRRRGTERAPRVVARAAETARRLLAETAP